MTSAFQVSDNDYFYMFNWLSSKFTWSFRAITNSYLWHEIIVNEEFIAIMFSTKRLSLLFLPHSGLSAHHHRIDAIVLLRQAIRPVGCFAKILRRT